MSIADSVSLWVGLRYTGARQGNLFVTTTSAISLIGLILGVVVLITVVSVMNGFDRELRYRILGVIPHGVITHAEGLSRDGAASLRVRVAAMGGVVGAAPYAVVDGMLTYRGTTSIARVYGVDPDYEAGVSVIPQHIQEGAITALVAESNGIIMGRTMAYQLGLAVGDELSLVVPVISSGGQVVVPAIKRVRVAGTFEMGSEVDYQVALMHVVDVARMHGGQPRYGVRVKLAELVGASRVMATIGEELGDPQYRMDDWTRQYGDLFRTVELEKAMMFLLLVLIVGIAGFNIVSGLIMLVSDKRGDVAILRTMGASRNQVRWIFIVQGSSIGFAGSLVGLALGVLVASNITDIVGWVESIVGTRVLAGTYFDSVPSEIRASDLVWIVAVAGGISFLSTIYPASRAAKLDPATTLRYE